MVLNRSAPDAPPPLPLAEIEIAMLDQLAMDRTSPRRKSTRERVAASDELVLCSISHNSDNPEAMGVTRFVTLGRDLAARPKGRYRMRHPDAFKPGGDKRWATAWPCRNQVLDTEEFQVQPNGMRVRT